MRRLFTKYFSRPAKAELEVIQPPLLPRAARFAQMPGFCAYPFVQLSTVPAGFFRPCCSFSNRLRDSEGRSVALGPNALEEAWQSESLRRVRRQMLAGERLKECRQCFDEEQVGTTSFRQRSFREWLGREDVLKRIEYAEQNQGTVLDPPKYLELKPGNLCNLKCRICNQFDSNQIAMELRELAQKYPGVDVHAARLYGNRHFGVNFTLDQMPDWSTHPEFWASLENILPHVETLSLAGGEPTLLREVRHLLRQCVETKHASHIHVFLATNFVRVDEELLELATHFAQFEFIGSLDGIGDIQEYIRFPSKWPVVAQNFGRAKSRMVENRLKALVNLTLQMNNILHFTDLLDWLEELNLEPPHFFHHPYAIGLLQSPRYLDIEVLPPKGRTLARERIMAYMDRSRFLRQFSEMRERFELILFKLNQPMPSDFAVQLPRFWRFTAILDEHRHQSFAEVDPELYMIVREELSNRNISLDVVDEPRTVELI